MGIYQPSQFFVLPAEHPRFGMESLGPVIGEREWFPGFELQFVVNFTGLDWDLTGNNLLEIQPGTETICAYNPVERVAAYTQICSISSCNVI